MAGLGFGQPDWWLAGEVRFRQPTREGFFDVLFGKMRETKAHLRRKANVTQRDDGLKGVAQGRGQTWLKLTGDVVVSTAWH